MVMSLGDLIEHYGLQVDGIRDEDYSDIDSLLALLDRDEIEDRWQLLSPPQRDEVLKIDRLLVSMHEAAAEILPSVQNHDRARWWWFLHEGPQVREEVEKLKQEAVA
jgi:hypothetical protein